MSDDLPTEGQETHDVRTLRGKLKEREGELEAARAQAARAEALERELAFAKAGVDLANPNAKYFTRGYDGELSPEAIKSEWGAFAGTAAPPVDYSADIAASERINAASSGAQSAGTPDQRAEMDAKLDALENSGIRDPLVLQKQAEAIMRASGVRFAE